MKRLQTFEFDLKFANLNASRKPTDDEVARHEIELTESGLIQHEKDLGKLFGVMGPQLTHICSVVKRPAVRQWVATTWVSSGCGVRDHGMLRRRSLLRRGFGHERE